MEEDAAMPQPFVLVAEFLLELFVDMIAFLFDRLLRRKRERK
jgi:hypothetical protein